ncbi:hypothetical protein DFH09DRAFT_1155682 [Mycena vulgaris]|nr:hypothetical protein DFH09DRAFT_1155682 [Mycena vulgaris]
MYTPHLALWHLCFPLAPSCGVQLAAHPASSSPQYGSHFNPGGRRGTCPWDILFSAATHGAQLILWRLLYPIPARFMAIERRRVSPWV